MNLDVPSITEPEPEDAAAGPTRFRPGRIAALAGGHGAHDVYPGMLSVLLPRFVERFALSNTRAGALSAFIQSPSILQPVFGHLADRLVLRWVVILGPGVTATVMSLSGWAPTYAVLALLFLITGVSSAAFHAVGSAAAGRLAERHLGKGLSVWMVGGELGYVLGPVLAAGALTFLTMKELSVLVVVGWTASCFLFWQLRRAPLRAATAGDRPHWRDSMYRMRRIMTLMGGLVMLRAMATSAPGVFAVIFLEAEGQSRFVAGAAVTVFQASGMLGTLAAGWISDLVGRQAMLLSAAFLGPSSLLGFALLRGWPRFVLLALAGATLLSIHPVCMALVQESFPESRGLANALYLSMVFVISSLGAVAVGALGDATSLKWAFLISALITFLSVPLILLLPREHRPQEAAG